MRHSELRLDELCAQITDGKHGDCEEKAGSGYYFLSCKDVVDGKLNYDGSRQITAEDFLDTHRRTKLEPLDILITNSGTIGRMAVAPPNELTTRTTFQKSVAILKPIPEKVEPRFLYYPLQRESERLIAFAGGTAQKNLLLRELGAFTVTLPPRTIQSRIASTLSAYDDLIENDTRRIKILEEMAQMIYREWFVNFRFPGHKDAPMVKSEQGAIPEGKLMAFTKKLNEEDKRGIAEQLTEEELVIFDLLTKPRIELNKRETADVKKVAKTLLEKLKQEKLVLDWRKQQTTRAMVLVTIQDVLNELPSAYTKELYEQKCDTVYQHFYEAYAGQGRSVYGANQM